MKKLIASILLVSTLNTLSCTMPTNTQTTEVWSGERSDGTSTLNLSKINDNYYTFIEQIQPKTGAAYETAGTLTFEGKEAIFKYTKPNNAMARAKYEIADSGKTYIYTINNSDTEVAILGSKNTYKKR